MTLKQRLESISLLGGRSGCALNPTDQGLRFGFREPRKTQSGFEARLKDWFSAGEPLSERAGKPISVSARHHEFAVPVKSGVASPNEQQVTGFHTVVF